MKRPTPNPSQEGNRYRSASCPFPSWEGLGVGSWSRCMREGERGLSMKRAQDRAVQAARAAGALMRRHFRSPKKIHSATQHDIKLELDVRSQKLIERTLRSAYPHIAVLGEEGVL